ncbi:uncharacterized protein LOC125834819 [Solanum verrucosum]|uniref:uncharacterized protein LOC125834819 n=1 Tax=Solanum verrucosum TaxID=315347 RepID=UPI0020D0CD8C|nr:uncharacterized protein LOC125834819 [Solanum verrucosum]
MIALVNRDVGPRVNANESTMDSRLRDFVRMNPPVFLGSNVGEDPQEFLDEVYKIVNSMGVTSTEKVELDPFQLKDVAQVGFTQCKSSRPVGAGPIEWEEFKNAFLGRYFPREKREVKVEEFINLRQGSMSVEEYSLKFTLLSKYVPYLVSNHRDETSRFVIGVSDLVKVECRTSILHDEMNISRLIVYTQSIEESKLEKKSRVMKRSRSNEQSQPRSKKRYAKCGKQHLGKCLAETDGCFGCGKKGHKMIYFPTLMAKGRDDKQASLDGLDPNGPKKNRFHVLQANKDKRAHPDEGTDMLLVSYGCECLVKLHMLFSC